MAYKLRRQRNNTSGLVGLRLRHRSTRTGLRRYFIEVSWQDHGRRAGTSIPVSQHNYWTAAARALAIHSRATGAFQGVNFVDAWTLLVRGYKRAHRHAAR